MDRTCNRRQRAQGATHVEYHSTPNRTSFFKGTLRELGPKRLELMREVMPRAAILVNPTDSVLWRQRRRKRKLVLRTGTANAVRAFGRRWFTRHLDRCTVHYL